MGYVSEHVSKSAVIKLIHGHEKLSPQLRIGPLESADDDRR